MPTRPRTALHPYQVSAIDFLLAGVSRGVIAVMGAGKTAIALHAIVDLQQRGKLSAGPVLVIAPLLIAETVWSAEVAAWEATSGLRVERVLGTAKQRAAALDRPADVYVSNFDNLTWLAGEIAKRGWRFSVLIADESSRLKNPGAQRTKIMMALGQLAERRWTLTGTPRGQQLLDIWGPAQFVTLGTAFPPFYQWRAENFFPVDPYERQWYPRTGAEAATVDLLRPFTYVVDAAALATRPPEIEILHDVPLDAKNAALYDKIEADSGSVALDIAAQIDSGLPFRIRVSEEASVIKLMQVLSGALYVDGERWQRLHDRRLDMLAEIHEGHDRPTLVFVGFRHEIARIKERFPAARELTADCIDDWSAGKIEMLVAHPASAGHGVNLQYGSDTLVWFSLPWSAELFQQANARLARQGQSGTVTRHILLSRERIDEIAYRAVRQRIVEQDRLISALGVPA
jgi:SNF2 family DNA or RNA helicase